MRRRRLSGCRAPRKAGDGADLRRLDRSKIEVTRGKFLETRGRVQIAPLGAEYVDLLLLLEDRGVEPGKLFLERLDLILDVEQADPDDDGQGEPQEGGTPPHSAAVADHGGASVLTAARRRAERARGLRAISSAPGLITRRFSR